MRRYKKMIPVLVLFFASCNNAVEQEPDGGPCSYQETAYPARLIQLEQQDSLSWNARFEVSLPEQPEKKDTVGFYQLNNQFIPTETIRKDSIAVGSLYQYVVMDIVSGHCNPQVIIIRLKKP